MQRNAQTIHIDVDVKGINQADFFTRKVVAQFLAQEVGDAIYSKDNKKLPYSIKIEEITYTLFFTHHLSPKDRTEFYVLGELKAEGGMGQIFDCIGTLKISEDDVFLATKRKANLVFAPRIELLLQKIPMKPSLSYVVTPHGIFRVDTLSSYTPDPEVKFMQDLSPDQYANICRYHSIETNEHDVRRLDLNASTNDALEAEEMANQKDEAGTPLNTQYDAAYFFNLGEKNGYTHNRLNLIKRTREPLETMHSKNTFKREVRVMMGLSAFRNTRGSISVNEGVGYLKQSNKLPGAGDLCALLSKEHDVPPKILKVAERVIITELLFKELLRQVHGQNVIHRDVKPDNIVIDLERKTMFYIDYGLSALANDKKSLSNNGGSLQYFAPELFLGGLPASPLTDAYSLFVVLMLVWGAREKNLWGTLTSRSDFEAYKIHNSELDWEREIVINPLYRDLQAAMFRLGSRGTRRDPGSRYSLEEVYQEFLKEIRKYPELEKVRSTVKTMSIVSQVAVTDAVTNEKIRCIQDKEKLALSQEKQEASPASSSSVSLHGLEKVNPPQSNPASSSDYTLFKTLGLKGKLLPAQKRDAAPSVNHSPH